jgi:hypothetical protein
LLFSLKKQRRRGGGGDTYQTELASLSWQCVEAFAFYSHSRIGRYLLVTETTEEVTKEVAKKRWE